MDGPNQSLSVEPADAGKRLDVFLAEARPDASRSRWKVLIEEGRVLINGQPAKPNHALRTGDGIAWSMPEPPPATDAPEPIPLDILYEDDAIVVLNKPPGLVVHPANGNESGTLVNALLYHDAAFGRVPRAGVVHRLDKDTSGVMVVAKTSAAMADLQRQFKARVTLKEYLALVWGRPPTEGRIETLIGRHPVHRQKMAVLQTGGREAVSAYRLVEAFTAVSLVRVRIETGRTHQIRVHLAHLGHPVVGDQAYGRDRKHVLPAPAERQMLHAARLEFAHPATQERICFEAPLHDDMKRLIERLRS